MSQITDGLRPWAAEHTQRYIVSGGADGHEWRPGVPTFLLTVTGAGPARDAGPPLIYGRDGDRWVVVASKGGAADHPAW